MKNNEDKIHFRDLSAWMKTAIVFVWIMAGVWTISFLVGFIQGLIGYGYY